MDESEVVVLIPARYHSTRFPGKPLVKIGGESMIKLVYDNCSSSGFKTYVVTDDDRIEEAVKNFGGNVIRVNEHTTSGTERVYLAFKKELDNGIVKFVVNVQGDEPLLTGEDLAKLIDYHQKSNFDIATMVTKKDSTDTSINDHNNVKVIFNEDSGRCYYFSRSAIPSCLGRNLDRDWYHHIGVYSYSVEAIKSFSEASQSKYEILERLEQLRAIELDMTIGAIEVDHCLIGVDSPEDIQKVEGVLSDKRCE